MHQHSTDLNVWLPIFSQLYEGGVRWLHNSSEYESDALFLAVLQKFNEQNPGKRFYHMVKLAEPNFDEDFYSHDRFVKKIKLRCNQLKVHKIDICQWMWRNQLNDDTQRLLSLKSQLSTVIESFNLILRDDIVSSFCCFPYTPAFANLCLSANLINSFAVYRNPLEREYDDILTHELSKNCYAIRPFKAGLALDPQTSVAALLDYASQPNSVAGVVVTASQSIHIQELLMYVCKKSL